MNIAPIQPPVGHAPGPPRAEQHPAPDSSRPVLEPSAVEAAAQQVRNGDDRRQGREAGGHADPHPQADAATRGRNPRDPVVGAILDVFA